MTVMSFKSLFTTSVPSSRAPDVEIACRKARFSGGQEGSGFPSRSSVEGKCIDSPHFVCNKIRGPGINNASVSQIAVMMSSYA